MSLLDRARASLLRLSFVSRVGDARLDDEAFEAGRCVEDQDFAWRGADHLETVLLARLGMQERALLEQQRLAVDREADRAGDDIEGFGLAAVTVLVGAAADRDGLVRQRIAVAGLQTADDHGLALAADPVGPAVGRLDEGEAGCFR